MWAPGTNIDISGGLPAADRRQLPGRPGLRRRSRRQLADLTGNTVCVTGIVGVAANCRAVDALGTFAGRLGFALNRVLFAARAALPSPTTSTN
jgi:hypothetical protein